MSSKLILSVTLSLFYGVATYNAKGEITSKNELVSITQGSSEWENFMKHLKANGITEVKVVKAYDLNKVNNKVPVDSPDRYEEVEDLQSIQDEVDKYFKAPEKPMTAEQLQIKELREKLEFLTNGTQFKVATANDVEDVVNAAKLSEARERYFAILGKKGGPSWTVDQINEKITEFETLQTARAKYKEVLGSDPGEALTLEDLEKAILEK